MSSRLTPARVLALFALWLLATVWLRPLALPDEGRYAGVAWEMLRSGDWQVPTLNGLPFFHKPPLFYWLTAASLQVFGVHPWSARLASVAGALLAGAALYLLLRRRADEATARSALAVLATMPFFYGGAQYANLDMLVAGCISAAVCAAVDAALALARGEPHRRSLLLAWAFVGLGVLAKGLIGIVLPGGVLLLWLLLQRRPALVLRLLWWPGPLLMLAIAAPWFLRMEQRFPDFLHYFFVYQHFQRFAETGFNNVQPVWFYPPATLLLALPWSLGLWWSLRRRPPLGPAGSGLASLMVVWLGVVIGFFSMPQSKLIGYVLPALPPLAALLAVAWRSAVSPRAFRGVQWGAGLLAVAAMAGVALSDDRSAAPLVPVLKAERQPGEPLLFVGRHVYDLPLLLQEPAPVPVLLAWAGNPALHKDGWEKELADAGAFLPEAAARILVERRELTRLLCAQPVSWVVSSPQEPLPELAAAAERGRTRGLLLRRLDLSAPAARSALCGGTPTSG